MKRFIALFAILFLQAGPMASLAISSVGSASCCGKMLCHQEKSCCKADTQKGPTSPLSQASSQTKVEKETVVSTFSFTQPSESFLKINNEHFHFFKLKTSSLFLTKSSFLI